MSTPSTTAVALSFSHKLLKTVSAHNAEFIFYVLFRLFFILCLTFCVKSSPFSFACPYLVLYICECVLMPDLALPSEAKPIFVLLCGQERE